MTLDIREYRCLVGGKEVIIETGRLAQQAGGAVTVRMGDTMLFCSTTMGSPRPGLDFFPLSVDYEEKMYAGGRVPGGFFRREGRPSEGAILTSRVIDRTLRPLFPKNMRNDVQVILMSLSHDKEHHVDMLGIIAASTALMISDIPWHGPVAGARIGLVDGQLSVNPTYSEMQGSKLDLRVSGTADAINMVECNAEEVDEATMLEALFLAHDSVQDIIALQARIRGEIGKAKLEPSVDSLDEALQADVRAAVEAPLREVMSAYSDRAERRAPLNEIKEGLLASYSERNDASIKHGACQARLRRGDERCCARAHHSRWAFAPMAGITPACAIWRLMSGWCRASTARACSLRGETQVLTIATLGTPREAQFLDGLSPEDDKRYMHHYNFPPYSTGETYPMRGPRRREIGHGALAEKALLSMIPGEEEFPLCPAPGQRGDELQRQHLHGQRLWQYAGFAGCRRAHQEPGGRDRHGGSSKMATRSPC